MHRAPTINDLRVKLCYVCHEEETYDAPPNPPRRWVHPCTCTLIAHEDCLLQWIRAAEQDPSRAASTLLRCPQCGTRYVMESANPLVLRAMDNLRALLTLAGHGAAILTIGAAVTAVATGVYIVTTSYGAFALRCLIGPEMFKLLVPDDVHNWPLHAFINFPMIPLSLIMSRTRRFRHTVPLIPLLALWPSSPAVVNSPRGFLSFLGLGASPPFGMGIKPPIPSLVWKDTIRDVFCSWPPSPLILNIGCSVLRHRYNDVLERFRKSILGPDLPAREQNDIERGREQDRDDFRQVVIEDFAVEMRIDEEDDERAEAGEDDEFVLDNIGDGGQEDWDEQQNGPDRALGDDHNVRLVLDGAAEAAGGEPLPPVEHLVPDDQVPAPPNAPEERHADINADMNVREEQGRIQQPDEGLVPAEGDQNGRARLRLRLTGATVGSLIGGALLLPPIAAGMGALLRRLALSSTPFAHERVALDALISPNSPRRLLQRFLAIRPPHAARALGITDVYAMPQNQNSSTYVEMSIALVVRIMLVGTPAWTNSDPVWWRNMLGLGIFCISKDMLTIWYQYLSRREVRSRRLKDRDFSGIDPTTLDLTPEAQSKQSVETNSGRHSNGNATSNDVESGESRNEQL